MVGGCLRTRVDNYLETEILLQTQFITMTWFKDERKRGLMSFRTVVLSNVVLCLLVRVSCAFTA